MNGAREWWKNIFSLALALHFPNIEPPHRLCRVAVQCGKVSEINKSRGWWVGATTV
jgi:hypothetical protein